MFCIISLISVTSTSTVAPTTNTGPRLNESAEVNDHVCSSITELTYAAMLRIVGLTSTESAASVLKIDSSTEVSKVANRFEHTYTSTTEFTYERHVRSRGGSWRRMSEFPAGQKHSRDAHDASLPSLRTLADTQLGRHNNLYASSKDGVGLVLSGNCSHHQDPTARQKHQ
jgi:hypothetical protein